MEFAVDGHLVAELAKTGEKVAVKLALDLVDRQCTTERKEMLRRVAVLLRKLQLDRKKQEQFPNQPSRRRTVEESYRMLKLACDELEYREEREREVRVRVVDFLKSHRLKNKAESRNALDDYLGRNRDDVVSVELLEADAVVEDFLFTV